MHPAGSYHQDVLPGNLATYPAPPENNQTTEPGTFSDLIIGVGVLALLATALTIIGYHFGGPIPRFAFWRTFGPLMLVPLAIFLGLVLGPGAPSFIRTSQRIGLAVAGLFLFALGLALLNGPSILLLGL
jgi:hypothetical protein